MFMYVKQSSEASRIYPIIAQDRSHCHLQCDRQSRNEYRTVIQLTFVGRTTLTVPAHATRLDILHPSTHVSLIRLPSLTCNSTTSGSANQPT